MSDLAWISPVFVLILAAVLILALAGLLPVFGLRKSGRSPREKTPGSLNQTLTAGCKIMRTTLDRTLRCG